MSSEYLEAFYAQGMEDQRLLSRHGSVEYLTTMRYIHAHVKPGAKVLETGAGTGRYSLQLSREGYDVDAVELIRRHVDVFRAKLTEKDRVRVHQGNALDLSRFADETFDAVLTLGPMYHLYTEEDRLRCLKEAKRVLKPGGVLFVAYCLNEATLIQWGFKEDGENFLSALENGMLTEDFHCLSEPKDLFRMERTEEIERLNEKAGLRRLRLAATDLFTHYIADRVDAWSDEVFEAYLRYHFSICERGDLIGVSNHVLDIVQKAQ